MFYIPCAHFCSDEYWKTNTFCSFNILKVALNFLKGWTVVKVENLSRMIHILERSIADELNIAKNQLL